MTGIQKNSSKAASRPSPGSRRQRLCAAGRLRSCTCGNPSTLCCPASKIYIDNIRWRNHHLIYIDNKLEARRHSVVDWKRDLCRRDHGGCWRKGICFHIILFFGRRDRDFHFAIFTFFRNTSSHYFYFLRKKDPSVWNSFIKHWGSCQHSDKLLTHFSFSILAFLCYF